VAHGAELTPAGEAFLEMVQGMPALAERGKHAARRASRGEIGSLRVGFTASSAFNAVVPAAIRAFRRAYGDVELTLEESNTLIGPPVSWVVAAARAPVQTFRS
jgi:DNA-binding transcriptional LysR family regulator